MSEKCLREVRGPHGETSRYKRQQVNAQIYGGDSTMAEFNLRLFVFYPNLTSSDLEKKEPEKLP